MQASGGGDGRMEQHGPHEPVVARVRVRVRSSIYLIVAEGEKDGSMLLDQVCTLPQGICPF